MATYLVGHMKDEEFVPCDVSTDMREPQMHGVYLDPTWQSAIVVTGILDGGVLTYKISEEELGEPMDHLMRYLKEKIEEKEDEEAQEIGGDNR